ncbi:hypothetical protein JD844_015407 [Phrynosoma platyrhinos]|uniref:Tonsoku-like protein n=1 Tax=Phrynosoma platyrhinos TaxID=52577 RepID=A0ABQ7SJ50_PHRPL|nr:hypothetical protein JD844_015407 [Phrynosoma platyrhinos]
MCTGLSNTDVCHLVPHEGKTWLSIALAKEEVKESYDELEPCFQKALHYAKKACDPRLQHQVLQYFQACQQRCGRPEATRTLAQLQDLRHLQGWRSDGEISEGEVEEEEEPQNSEPLEASDLELSDSVTDVNLLYFLPEIVRLLLDHGAAIDDPGGPGCDGITPLHDALNCGHFDVAELLIWRGASTLLRNAKGQTPLGTLQEWMRLYGRDLDQETRERCKAMEELLRKAMAGRGEKLGTPGWGGAVADNPDFSLTLKIIPKYEICGSRENKQKCPIIPREQPASQLFDAELSESQGSSPQGSSGKPLSSRRSQTESEAEEACMIPLRPVKKRQRLLSENLLREEQMQAKLGETGLDAPSEYRAAMWGLGGALSRAPPSPERPSRPSAVPALIHPDEYVGDDWLEDDLGLNLVSRKRSRPSPPKELGSEYEESPEEVESNDGLPHQPPEATRKRQRRRTRQARLTQIVNRTPLGRIQGASVVGQPEPTTDPSNLHGAGDTTRVEGMLAGGESLPSGFMPVPALPPPIRVRVQVQDNVFLIPVPHSGSETHLISWLAEQASQRYYQACGLLPQLILKKEGALLAPQDRIVDRGGKSGVVGVHARAAGVCFLGLADIPALFLWQVLAEVQSWNLPPLVERYRKACRSLGVGEHQLLLKMLERQESGSSFSISNVALQGPHLTPLLRALKLQTSIQQLSLSGTGLGDDSAEELLASISTMPALKLLNLSANRLGPVGLGKLAKGAPGPVVFQNLEELDLSLNPLGDNSCQSLASLVQVCPVLNTLKLQACSLTSAFLQHCRLLLANALKGKEDKIDSATWASLTVSHNVLGSLGLELLLKSLPCERLTHLEISSVDARPGDQQPLWIPVARYLAQEGCALTHLTFSGNGLNDAAVAELARCIPMCISLVSLDLSANPEISIVGLRTLLLALEERKHGLQFLNLAGKCWNHFVLAR